MNYLSIRLKLAAIWHLEQVSKVSDPKAKARHEEMADRLFIRAHLATK